MATACVADSEFVAELRADGRHDLADELERELQAADEQYERDLAELKRTDRRLKRREQRHYKADERLLLRMSKQTALVLRDALTSLRPVIPAQTLREPRARGAGRPAHRRASRGTSRAGPSESDLDPPPRSPATPEGVAG